MYLNFRNLQGHWKIFQFFILFWKNFKVADSLISSGTKAFISGES